MKQKRERENDKINDKKNSRKKALTSLLFSLLQENKYLTIPEMAALTKKSEPTVYRHLDRMIAEDRLERVGSRKTGFWLVK